MEDFIFSYFDCDSELNNSSAVVRKKDDFRFKDEFVLFKIEKEKDETADSKSYSKKELFSNRL